MVVEQLEKAFVRDAISGPESGRLSHMHLYDSLRYTAQCSKLLGQFKVLQQMLSYSNTDVATFMREYGVRFDA